MRDWIKSGDPWVWLSAGGVSISLVAVFGIILLIAIRGLGFFWPLDVMEAIVVEDGSQSRLIGEITEEETIPAQHADKTGSAAGDPDTLQKRYLVKVGNRDKFGFDFRWVPETSIKETRYPHALMVVERREWGNLYGYIKSVSVDGKVVAEGESAWAKLQELLPGVLALHDRIRHIERDEIGSINYKIERLRLKKRKLELANETDPEKFAELERQKEALDSQYKAFQDQLIGLYQEIGKGSFTAEIMDGRTVDIPLSKVVRAYRPNEMGVGSKLAFYAEKLWELLTEDPREANTEGGIFPCIFGTVVMVLIMSVIVTPFGVIAALYLKEYAKQGILTRLVRIAVNNLAGVPSIVYGVFGLGFFVYFIGGWIDEAFFPEALPDPTFGTPGLLWASLTLALLTLPVVIVSTEEGLARIPSNIREGSLALGATKAETLWRTIIPMASPAMMTGLILAVARAAGEVAPLMLVGVVKLAPSLPIDGNYPFIHLERKFMHLGFHIYDLGFQSPNVDAVRPLVFATAFLLVVVIMILNLTSIAIRNHLREKYRAIES
ncbi:MAG: phosphate ABC transporter permease PstA [Deltaproteobacteria bacterium]